MKREIALTSLETLVKEFNARHETRPVTLRLIQGTTPMTEGERIQFLGLDVERRASGALEVEIVMRHDGNRHLAHTVKDVERVMVEMEKGNREKRLILESRTGEQTIMAFV